MRSAKFLACAAAVLLTACTPPTQYPVAHKDAPLPPQPPVQRARQMYLKQTAGQPVICTVGADCNEKWANALTWVEAHSQYSVKTHTDTEISTYGPIEPTTDSAFTITKTQNDANSMAIHFSSSCSASPNVACVPTTLELNSQFHNYLLTGANSGNF